jgi:hypothetical protein
MIGGALTLTGRGMLRQDLLQRVIFMLCVFDQLPTLFRPGTDTRRIKRLEEAQEIYSRVFQG